MSEWSWSSEQLEWVVYKSAYKDSDISKIYL